MARSKGRFWQEYQFTDPEARKMLPEAARGEKADDAVACAGAYKRWSHQDMAGGRQVLYGLPRPAPLMKSNSVDILN